MERALKNCLSQGFSMQGWTRLLNRYSQNQNVAGCTAGIIELDHQLKMIGCTKLERIPSWIQNAMASVISAHGMETVLELINKYEAKENELLSQLVNHLVKLQIDGTQTKD
jgi:hypothetical protein